MKLGSVVVLEVVENVKITIQDRDNEPAIIKREKKEVEFMVQIFCNAKHMTKDNLCLDCCEFLAYAKKRLDNCPYHAKKPACGICDLSCYEPKKKEKGLKVFTYSGPRMFFKHPVLAFRHLMDAFNQPKKPNL